jgi:hypothetical protein
MKQREEEFVEKKRREYEEKLPAINKKKKQRKLRKFRVAAISVYFTIIIRNRYRKFMAKKKDKSVKYHKQIIQLAIKSMKTYYYELLEEEITQYMLILEKKSKFPRYKADEEIMRMLIYMTEKIKAQPIPKSLIETLELICPNYCFFPYPYFFASEMTRLEFSEEYGCTSNMN